MIIVGMQEYLDKLNNLGLSTVGVCKMGVYDGAAVMAKAIASAVDSIPTVSEKRWGTPNNKIKGITAEQKAGLKNGLGIAKIVQSDGMVHTHVGFDGYNGVKTKKYPNGQPNALIARSIESGTSFRNATHFASKAIRSATGQCEAAMKKTVEKKIKEIMEE